MDPPCLRVLLAWDKYICSAYLEPIIHYKNELVARIFPEVSARTPYDTIVDTCTGGCR